jgi:hypothetical protein
VFTHKRRMSLTAKPSTLESICDVRAMGRPPPSLLLESLKGQWQTRMSGVDNSDWCNQIERPAGLNRHAVQISSLKATSRYTRQIENDSEYMLSKWRQTPRLVDAKWPWHNQIYPSATVLSVAEVISLVATSSKLLLIQRNSEIMIHFHCFLDSV